jgi:hypothetical protein
VRLGRGTGSKQKTVLREHVYEDHTTQELRILRRSLLMQLMQPEHPWKGWYYFGGLLAAVGAVYLIIERGA